MMPKHEEDEEEEKLWKRARKPGRIAVGDTIKVKGELVEKWNVRKIHIMKLGNPPSSTHRGKFLAITYQGRCRCGSKC